MKLELLKQIANKKLDLLHSENVTLKVLYGAIESCSNEDFTYNRHLVRDMFEGNESLIEKKGDKWYYVHSDVVWTHDPNESSYDQMIMAMDEELDIKTEDEINTWVEITYKRFVFAYFDVCLQRLDELNEELF